LYAKDEKKFFDDFSAAFHKLEDLGTINLSPTLINDRHVLCLEIIYCIPLSVHNLRRLLGTVLG
jgi:hypothetical protein